jgi:hypothetical protein
VISSKSDRVDTIFKRKLQSERNVIDRIDRIQNKRTILTTGEWIILQTNKTLSFD